MAEESLRHLVRLRLAALLMMLWVAATSISCDSSTGPDTSGPVVSLTILSYPITVFIADSIRLTAIARNAKGNVVPNTTFTWTSTDTTLATVDANGVVRGRKRGSVSIFAASGALQAQVFPIAQANLYVASLYSLTLPVSISGATVGDTVRLTPVARDTSGPDLRGVDYVWTSSDTSVATVDKQGLVSAKRLGSATITVDRAREIG
jgi:alpha-amylase